MKTVRLTMAQALVRFLENQIVSVDGQESRFVRGIMMLPGHGNVVGLGQGIEQELKTLELYQGKNEQGMAHAAVAFARQRTRTQIFACTSSIGPGAANMVTAAAAATANCIPVLFLPGDIYASRQPDPVLQQLEQPQELAISTNDAFRPVCRYFDRVNRPEQLMSAMMSAMRVLTDPADTGAVCVALPQDVQAEAYDYPESFFMRRVHRIARRPAEAYAVEEAVGLIAASNKPLLVCGGGVRYSHAGDAFRRFAEDFGIPFGETQAGKSAVAWDHPLNMGGIGVTGGSAANELAAECDLVIGVGTRYTDFTTSSKWLFRNPAVRFVNVNVSEFHALKLDAAPVIADAREGLDALSHDLKRRGYHAGWGGSVEAARSRWLKELDRLDKAAYAPGFTPEVNDANRESVERFRAEYGAELTQTAVLGYINRAIAPDAVVVGASGSLPGCMQRMWRASVPNTYQMEYGYSTMGYEIAGALGAKLAEPNREVYAFAGDGSFMMLHSELVTSLQEHLKINVLLFDNGSFGCINNLQVAQGNRTAVTEHRFREGAGHDGKYLPIDYAKIAEGYGCKAYTARTMEELAAALEDAKRQPCSTLIDIKVLPKTMTNGYGAWWRVGVAEASGKDSVKQARTELDEHLARARKY